MSNDARKLAVTAACLWLSGLLGGAYGHAESASAPPAVLELNVGETLHLTRMADADVDIKIDGELNEAVWARGTVVSDFIVIDPDTMVKPRWESRVSLIYTERGIYFGYDYPQPPETIVSVLSPRDTGTQFGDFCGLVLDTSGEGKYGYWMSLAPSGVKTDGTLIPEANFNRDWDGIWLGETAITEHGWTAEIFVPWSQLAMPKRQGTRKMGLFLSRRVAAIGERWSVPALPFTITKWAQHMRPMELEGVDPRQQWSVIPYSSVTEDQVREQTKVRAGAEVFWSPSTNFQLSATLLPDFGNVESDDVVVNLSAVETFFPEKRLFFLEGRDVFLTTPRADAQRNFFPITVVNTRRIGGAARPPNVPDGVTIPVGELNRPVELHAAVKATGQIGFLRYGLLGASEDDITFRAGEERFEQSGSDYAVARLLWEDSSFGGYRAIGAISTLAAHPEEDASVYGLDFHYLTRHGTWKLDGEFLYSDKDSVGTGWGGHADLVYTPRRGLKFNLDLEHHDDKLDINDLGFIPRNNVSRARAGMDYTNANIGWARQIRWEAQAIHEINGNDDVTRRGFSVSPEVLLGNLGRLDAKVALFGRRTDDLESFGNGDFKLGDWWQFELDYFSDPARPFSYRIGADVYQEKIHGAALTARASFSWRPSLRMKVDLLTEYVRRDGWLLHQEADNFTTFETQEWRPTLGIDYFFNAKHQLRLSAQWVAIKAREARFFKIPDDGGKLIPGAKPPGPSDDFTISNLNVQLRYRWELAPLSDLFVVYTLSGLQMPDRASFWELFESAYKEPETEQIVLKLRYRFGS